MKQRKKQRKEVEKTLKPEIVQKHYVKTNLKIEQQHIWKPKQVTVSWGAQSIPNHREIEVTILDDTG
ncbi:hypothetical protein Hanom_Chr05g00453421 [Helianthus anomalus]